MAKCGSGALAHAEPELSARHRNAHATRWLDLNLALTSLEVIWVLVIWSLLDILAGCRAGLNHELLGVALHLADVEQVSSAPPAPYRFNKFRRHALTKQGRSTANPTSDKTTFPLLLMEVSVDLMWMTESLRFVRVPTLFAKKIAQCMYAPFTRPFGRERRRIRLL